MSDCIFCKIADGDLPADKIYEDAEFIAFKDLYPKASVHVLVIPKKHIASLVEQTSEDIELMGRLTALLPKIAKACGLKGFRTIINTGPEGGQEVFHLHYHVLGGANLPGFSVG